LRLPQETCFFTTVQDNLSHIYSHPWIRFKCWAGDFCTRLRKVADNE